MKISVALCTYNGEDYLSEQLDSIFAQTHKVEEIIICDDCSTDNTLQIIKNYQERYPKSIYLYQNKENLGSTKNFEKAINLCNNELIFLCDQDDIWLPEKVAKVYEIFIEQPNISGIFHNLFLYENNQKTPLTIWEFLGFNPNNIPLQDFLLFFGNVVTGMALAIKRPLKPIVLNNVKNSRFLHDYLLALNYINDNQLFPLNESLGYYRKHDKQQVGYKKSRLKKDYHTKVYNNPLCLYLHLNKRIKYLQKNKNIHKKMPIFIEKIRRQREDLRASMTTKTLLKHLPSFLNWVLLRVKIKILKN